MSSNRKPLSKRLRFDVFKRDAFICQYCGQCPPAVVLEIDHIIALAAGGADEIDNLTTACFDCNRGKGARDLTLAPATVADKAALIIEKREQLKAFERLLKQEQRRMERNIDSVQEALFPEGNWRFTDRFRISIKGFLERLSVTQVVTLAELSAARIEDPEHRTKYLCGCCWRTINGDSRHGRFRRTNESA